ncbi:MAG: hypothetical protein PHH40_04515 [Candidatus Moranbacteria bacterium]|nr:hypothetical protein [Candidatus Moranbacteria bacterium]MDD3964500.1 hypothetical protein [Candidatus Moranbacteria bacterium]
MGFEDRIQKNIPIASETNALSEVSDNGVADDEEKKIEVLKEFEADRVKVWSEREGFTTMENEARNEKRSTTLEQQSTLEFLEAKGKEIQSLQGEIAQKKDSWIGRLIEFKTIRALEKTLQMVERMKNSAEEDKKRTDELIVAYDYIIAKDQNLTALKAEEKAMMEMNAQEQLAKREQEEQARSVENISKKYSCFFIHDLVDADWKPSENNRAIDTKNLLSADQLDIVLGLDPTISVSTLREGNSADKTFGKGSWGVFLSGGKVLGGEPRDMGTSAYGLRERSVSKNSRSLESIDEAIISPHKASYNELVVEKPEVAGVYIKWGESMPPLSETTSVQNGNGSHYDRWWENLQSMMKRNVPIFILTPDNRTRLIHHVNFQEKTFEVATKDMKPEDMVDLPGIYKQHIGEVEKRGAAMRQINAVRHLLSPEEVLDIETGAKLTDADMKNNPYRLQ